MATGTGLTGSSNAVIDLRNVNTIDLSEVLDPLEINTGINWTYGTGANQMNVLYHDTVAIADGANTTLDLFASGALLDAFGNVLTMAAIKLLFIRNNSSDAILEVFGGVALDLLIVPATSDIIDIHPGGFFLWVCPTAAGVVTSTNKNLYLVHNGTGSSSMNVDVVAGGLD